MTDFWNNITDDGTPRAALDVAGQGVRSFNHRSAQQFDPDRKGWQYAPDAYRCIGELKVMTRMITQATEHLANSLEDAAAKGYIGIDAGTKYAGRLGQAVDDVLANLGNARDYASMLSEQLEYAQRAINSAHYSGPPLQHDD